MDTVIMDHIGGTVTTMVTMAAGVGDFTVTVGTIDPAPTTPIASIPLS